MSQREKGERALVGNSADKAQVDAARTKERQRGELLKDDVRWLAEQRAGRRILRHLIGHCRTFATVFTANDVATIAHNAGRQDVGHYLMSLCELAGVPEAILNQGEDYPE